jgi:ABC-type antimicrobial peptide transport system permease subunit
VAIVDAALAAREWPRGSALGHRVRVEGDSAWRTIVGVVRPVRQVSLAEVPAGTIYLPYAQSPGIFSTVVARTDGHAATYGVAVREAIWRVDRDQPVWKIRTMDDLVRRAVGAPRFTMQLVAAFAVLALVLAAVGIYGVISYTVAQRTREIGLRVALGARRADVLALVVRRGLLLTAVAITVGVGAALWAARLLRSQLFGVATIDPITFGAVPLVLTAVALVATLVPAWRASRVSPMVALRSD